MNRTLAADTIDWSADGSDLWEDGVTEEWSDAERQLPSAVVIAFPDPLHSTRLEVDNFVLQAARRRFQLSIAGFVVAVSALVHFAFSDYVVYVIPTFAAAFYFLLNAMGSWAESRDLVAGAISKRTDYGASSSSVLAKVA